MLGSPTARNVGSTSLASGRLPLRTCPPRRPRTMAHKDTRLRARSAGATRRGRWPDRARGGHRCRGVDRLWAPHEACSLARAGESGPGRLGVCRWSLPGRISRLASAPIIGLTIQSPADGEQVSTKEVTVIGPAPPGMKITRDISFFPDQHATADSTGHWAIAVSPNEGNNDLVFRSGMTGHQTSGSGSRTPLPHSSRLGSPPVRRSDVGPMCSAILGA